MKNINISDLIFFVLISIFLSCIALFLAIPAGPQISHIFNCLALLLLIYHIAKFFTSLGRDKKIYRKIKTYKLIILFLLIMIEILFSVFLIIVRYGYSN